jgi:hypothetical protein
MQEFGAQYDAIVQEVPLKDFPLGFVAYGCAMDILTTTASSGVPFAVLFLPSTLMISCKWFAKQD